MGRSPRYQMPPHEWTQHVSGFYIVNLDHHVERLRQTRETLEALGIPKQKIFRVQAIQEDPGYIGCAKSHLKAVRRAMRDAEGQVEEFACILEDDLMIHESAQHVHSAVERLVRHRGGYNKFDAIHLAMTPIRLKRCTTPPGARVWFSYGLAGTLFHKSFLPKVEKVYAEAVRTRMQIDVAFATHLQSTSRVYGFYPPVMRQRPGYSEIEKKHVDYEYLEVGGKMIK